MREESLSLSTSRFSTHLKCRADHGHHRGLAIASKTVLQNARKLAVAIRNVLTPTGIRECSNHVSERAQTLVDLLGLFEALTSGTREPHALTTGQIHQVKFANLHISRRESIVKGGRAKKR
jgi:hypothetical protein